MVTLECLKKGFSLYCNPVSAILRIHGSYLYLARKGEGWIFGHSTDGFSFFIRPDGNQCYQYIYLQK